LNPGDNFSDPVPDNSIYTWGRFAMVNAGFEVYVQRCTLNTRVPSERIVDCIYLGVRSTIFFMEAFPENLTMQNDKCANERIRADRPHSH
jgi:hypothetical protein